MINNLDRNSDEWIKRNEEYYAKLKYMRINGICAFEKDNEYAGLPTLEELELIQLMSTSLSKRTLKHMIKKLGYDFKMLYKFSTD